jgi:GNAT superfamily N-acetyltransferase
VLSAILLVPHTSRATAGCRCYHSRNTQQHKNRVPIRFVSLKINTDLGHSMKPPYTIRNATPAEFSTIGKLMVQVYSQLEGFPKESEQPNYYQMLANVGELTKKPGTEILVAISSDEMIAGAVVYFNDMKNYGSGGTATQEQNAAGFRLLAVADHARGQGIGKLLTNACIQKAKANGLRQLIIHTTNAMQTAWKMYESLGFKRSPDLDFMQGELQVFGFRLGLG